MWNLYPFWALVRRPQERRATGLGGEPLGLAMWATFDEAFSASALFACVQFITFLAIGAMVGWLLSRPRRWASWSSALSMIGVCGAWTGAEFAHLIGQAEHGSADELAAAAIGALGLAYAWRRLHPSETGEDIAIHQSHA
ncbi:hypothetical protein MJC1_00516 [Methylocystis sp. MJC1]|nr:hypothetical protein MJC1_00516 [Methylocystis sp. MJC1]